MLIGFKLLIVVFITNNINLPNYHTFVNKHYCFIIYIMIRAIKGHLKHSLFCIVL